LVFCMADSLSFKSLLKHHFPREASLVTSQGPLTVLSPSFSLYSIFPQ
jgi:hypothetical protein